MRTLYIAINGETKGPFTTDQIFNMWNAGEIPADSFYFNDQSQEWEQLAGVVDGFKPKKGIEKFFNPPPPTKKEQKDNETFKNNGCGCMSIIIAAFMIVFAIAGFDVSSSKTKKETEVSREAVSNPAPVYRDIYKVYSPEEERAYRQKKIDSQYKIQVKEKEVSKSHGEQSNEMFIAVILLLIGLGFGGLGVRYYWKAHKQAS